MLTNPSRLKTLNSWRDAHPCKVGTDSSFFAVAYRQLLKTWRGVESANDNIHHTYESPICGGMSDPVSFPTSEERSSFLAHSDIAIRNLDYTFTVSSQATASASPDILANLENILDLRSSEPWSYRRPPKPTAKASLLSLVFQLRHHN
ncbi:PREDICTED: ankyrin repeat family [Prunus dulcis]|uniref:PREDICTED: ankyrin repeat family n=1 Tax=Prunus dulcis TaxID=3755 RepID=A0A5E4F2A1_PRUDU|nr:PREDICTED: ankyrin repeat family [Prunus dulcis]